MAHHRSPSERLPTGEPHRIRDVCAVGSVNPQTESCEVHLRPTCRSESWSGALGWPARGDPPALPRVPRTDLRLEVGVVVDGETDDSRGLLARRTHRIVRCASSPSPRTRPVPGPGRRVAGRAGAVLIAPRRPRARARLVPPAIHLAAHPGRRRAASGDIVGLYRERLPRHPLRTDLWPRHADGRLPGRTPTRAPADTTWRYWAGNASVTRGTADRVGGYDEAFRAYGWEDVDWGRRLHLLGIPVVLEPALETTHRLSAVTAASRVERAYFSGAARRQFVAKHGLSELAPRRPDSSWTRAVALVAPGAHGSRAVARLARRMPWRRAAGAGGSRARRPARRGRERGGLPPRSVDDPTAV